MSPLFVACLLIVVALASAGTEKPVCPINSELKQCGGLCESTCRRQEKILCSPKDPDSCKEECECVDGFVRDETNECVKPSECPAETTTEVPTTEEPTTEEPTTKEPTTVETTTESRCPTNETMNICGRMCEPTCKNKKPNTLFCPGIQCTRFTENCRCEHGYYRNGKGKCVLSKDCPKDANENKCGDNEELGPCGKRCERTCDEPNKANCISILCLTRDCRCKDGYSRDKDEKCIRNEDCPKKGCKSGEISGCRGHSCEGTCDRPYRPLGCLLLTCGKKGCQCDLANGYVRDQDSNKCVQKKDCPKNDDY